MHIQDKNNRYTEIRELWGPPRQQYFKGVMGHLGNNILRELWAIEATTF
jgi:hypothetical protein